MANTIGLQLEALTRQTRQPDEVVIADNGSSDHLAAVVAQTQTPFVTKIINASQRPGSAFARNQGAKYAKFDTLAFCDADDVAAEEWLSNLVAGLKEADLVGGQLRTDLLNREHVVAWRPARPKDKLNSGGFLPFVPSGNMAVSAAVFQQLGGFNENYPKSHDVELSWRAQLAGYTLGYAPGAVLNYRYRSTLSEVFRQAVRSGEATVQLHKDYRAAGHLPRSPLNTSKDWLWLGSRLPHLSARRTRGLWLRKLGEAVGRLRGSIRYRVYYL